MGNAADSQYWGKAGPGKKLACRCRYQVAFLPKLFGGTLCCNENERG